jgi:hypothetical protein
LTGLTWSPWQMRNLRLQLQIDDLLDADYEEVVGFSPPRVGVRGSATADFCATDRHAYGEDEGGHV